MNNNLPTTPGPYWLKEDGGEKWIPVYIKDASHVPGWELSVLFPESEAELDLQDIKGQWAKAHRPDEGIEAWAVFGSSGKPQAIDRDPDMCRSKVCHWDQESWNILMKHGYTCRKVRVCEEVCEKPALDTNEKERI